MTKKTLAALLVLGSLASTAALADDDVGCGWGSLIWAGQSGVVPKALASTTNGLLGNQTFGITSGTLGCSQNGVIKADVRRTKFASANLDQLAAESAAGEGESLTTLAALYNVDATDRAAFASAVQAHHAELFAAGTTGGMLTALDNVLAADARLSRYV